MPINDVDVQVSIDAQTVSRTGFGVPAIAGFTNPYSVAIFGEASSSLAVRGSDRAATGLSAEIVQSGNNISFGVASGKLTITIPTAGATVNQVIDAFSSANVSEFQLFSPGSGAGQVAVSGTQNLVDSDVLRITNIEQLSFFYDNTDVEYKQVSRMLSQRPHVTQIYLINCAGLSGSDLAAKLTDTDDGAWYCLLSTETTVSILEVIRDWVATRQRIALLSATSIGDIANIRGVNCFPFVTANDDHFEFGVAAKVLASDPGTAKWKWQSLLNYSPSGYTSTELQTIRDEGGIAYASVQNLNTTTDSSTVVNNQRVYIDDTRQIDYVTSELRAAWLELLINAENKIPYDDSGAEVITSLGRSRLEQFGNESIIAVIGSSRSVAERSQSNVYQYRVDSDPVQTIRTNRPADVTARVFELTFAFVLAGAIENIRVRGRASLTL